MKPKPHSSANPGRQASAGIGLDDVYFTLFRHKVILLTCLFLGLAGVIVARMVTKPVYSSQARLLVSYIVQRTEVAPVNQDAAVVNPGSESVLTAETEILTSLDLAKEVAMRVGPERILAFNKTGGSNVMDAAGLVRAGISAFSPRKSDVMFVYYYHPDSTVVQPVLEAIIEEYLRMHRSVRMATEFDEKHYSEQLVQIRNDLTHTEEEIKEVLSEAKVISIEEAKVTYAKQISRLEDEMLDARSQLYSLNATMTDAALTNNETGPNALIPADKLDSYANVLASLSELRKRERELLVQGYKEAHPQVKDIRNSIADFRKTKTELEQEYEGLALNENVASTGDYAAEQAQIRALVSKIKGHESQLTDIQSKVFKLLDIEPRIKELERQRTQEEQNFHHVASNLDKARASVSGDNGVTGIKVFERPTPPYPTNKKLQKLTKILLGGFIALGLGIAVLIDYVLDRTIKRSVDVRRHMRLPLFLSIPHTGWGGKFSLSRFPFMKLLPGRASNGSDDSGAVTSVTPPWDTKHHLRVYSEGLRERLITYFEVNAINHRPKLIGVTSCGDGAGVTTLASGVAAALSQTGDGNVLLVDMSGNSGETHSFYKGKPGCGLADVLEPGGRAEAQVQENLYLVSMQPTGASNSSDIESPNKLLPSRFNKFMPELKTSDYDYVIFDMPPVTPTSVTPRLAGNMDRLLLVIEAEKTQQQTAHEASVLLEDARANAAVVLNKCKRHVPKMLSPEL